MKPTLLILACVYGPTHKANYALIPIDESFKRRRALLPKLAKVMEKGREQLDDVKFTFKMEGVVFGNFDVLADDLRGQDEMHWKRKGFHVYVEPEEVERALRIADSNRCEQIEMKNVEVVFTANDCRVVTSEGLIRLETCPFHRHSLLFAELAATA